MRICLLALLILACGCRTVSVDHNGGDAVAVAMPDDGTAQSWPRSEAAGRHLLGSGRALPPYLMPIAQIRPEPEGIVVSDRHYLKTKSGEALTVDFTFELMLTIEKGESHGDIITFVGIGEADRNRAYNEPGRSIVLRWHAPGVADGYLELAGGEAKPRLGTIRQPGTHRLRIRKRASSIVFEIDVNDDGDRTPNLRTEIQDVAVFAPFLHDANAHLFFGGGALFREVTLSRDD